MHGSVAPYIYRSLIMKLIVHSFCKTQHTPKRNNWKCWLNRSETSGRCNKAASFWTQEKLFFLHQHTPVASAHHGSYWQEEKKKKTVIEQWVLHRDTDLLLPHQIIIWWDWEVINNTHIQDLGINLNWNFRSGISGHIYFQKQHSDLGVIVPKSNHLAKAGSSMRPCGLHHPV